MRVLIDFSTASQDRKLFENSIGEWIIKPLSKEKYTHFDIIVSKELAKLLFSEKKDIYKNCNFISLDYALYEKLGYNNEKVFNFLFSGKDSEKYFLNVENIYKSLTSGVSPDLILTFEFGNCVLKKIFPNTLSLTLLGGLWKSTKPDFSVVLDPINSCGYSFLVKYKDKINKFSINEEQKKDIQTLKRIYKDKIISTGVVKKELLELKEKYDHLILLPLQLQSYIFEEECNFKSQLDYLDYVMLRVPKNIGVIVTGHYVSIKEIRKIVAENKEKYPNLIILDELFNHVQSSLFVLPYVDAMINVCSSLLLKAILCDVPIISLGKRYSSWCEDTNNLDNIENFLNLQHKNKDNILYWYMTHYDIPSKILISGSFLSNYLTDKLNKDIDFLYFNEEVLMKDVIEYYSTLKYDKVIKTMPLLDFDLIKKDKDIEQKIVLANKNLKYFSDNLAIFLITYNRKDYMRRTLDSLISKVSPFRDCDITVLDNASTDGSSELIDRYCQMKSNIHHIKHKVNIGGNGNITRGFELGATCDKEYFWVICDDDKFDFSNASELVEKMRDKKDVICVSDYCIQPDENYNASIEDTLIQLTFVPAGIYKKSLMDGDIFTNMNHSIYTMFPQLCAPIHAVNKYGEDSISVLSSPIVFNGLHCDDPCRDFSYVRGLDDKELTKFHEDVSWILGFANAITLLKDKNLQKLVVEKAITNSETYGNLENFYFAMFNTYLHLDKFYRLFEIFRLLPSIYTLTFLLKAIYWKLTFRNLRDKFIKYLKKLNKNTPIEDAVYWASYFEKHNTQKYINKLAKKYKGKKILLYGNGIISKVIKENYDLANLNIVAITDRKFLGCDIIPEKYQAVSPNKLKTIDFDVIFFFLKKRNAELIGKTLKKNGIKQEQYKFIKK